MSTERKRAPCPVCDGAGTLRMIEIQGIPVHANLMWETRAQAIAAPKGDLALHFCPKCGHIFNAAFDSQRMQYTQDYENSLHFSPRFQEYAERLAASLVKRYGLFQKEILEIGCGQGDFLGMVCRAGGNRGVGFDPSYREEPGREADPAFRVIQEPYGEAYFDFPADLIICRQVLEHIEQPREFVAGVRRAVGERDSLVFFEVPNALYTLRCKGIWDLIYEHRSYFTPSSLAEAFRRQGFDVLRIAKVFGEQFLTIEAKANREKGAQSLFSILSADEWPAQLLVDAETFASHYRNKVLEWTERLARFQREGRTAVVWGAGSKGVTFLNILRGMEAIQKVIDINPRKHGKFISGSGQEIVPPDALRELKPDIILVMNQNYEMEIRNMLERLKVGADLWLV